MLKTVATGALGTVLLGGAVTADHIPSDDSGISAAQYVREWTEYQCVDSDCDDPCTDCDCNTKQRSRERCEDSIGHTPCGGWYDTGNCCDSC